MESDIINILKESSTFSGKVEDRRLSSTLKEIMNDIQNKHQ